MFEFKYQNIVVGGNLEALLYAYFTDSKLIFIKDRQFAPFPFEYFDKNENLLFMFFQNITKTYRLYPEGEEIVGVGKKKMYERMSFLCSLGGLIPFLNKVISLKIEDENKILIIMENFSIKATFEKLVVFDDVGISGLPDIKEIDKEKLCLVADWMDIKTGQPKEFKKIKTEDEFVREIIAFDSGRSVNGVRRKHGLYDIVVLSILREKELNEIGYTPECALMKTRKILIEAGVRGRRITCTRYPDKKYYNYPKLQLYKRDVRRLTKDIYKETENISFNYQTSEQIINTFRNSVTDTYTYFINRRFYDAY